MKKRSSLLFLSAASIFSISLLSGCGGGSNPTKTPTPSVSPTPSVAETPDGYVDKLPEATSDGAIFHAFCWTYKDIIKNLPAIYDAGFKSIQVSPVQQPKNGGSSWWSYYQPVSFAIAVSSGLGSKEDLINLCDEADKLGISIIADIVFNHLGNISDDDLEPDGTPMVSPDVANYEPYIYEHRNDADDPTFHHNKKASGSGAITQYYAYGALPDLNTANKHVQERCLSLLKECIDVGIDGFRFDAAKHIETPEDPQYASDFWPSTLGVAKEYYKEKYGKELFAYGEILGQPDGGRNISYYTKYMNVTDDTFIANIHSGIMSKKVDKILEASYGKKADPSMLITWAESHDTYTSSSSHTGQKKIDREWAIINSRKGSRGLYLARPDDSLTVGVVGDYSFENENIAAINRFHNRFANAEEYISSYDNVYINERVDSNGNIGAVIVELSQREQITVELSKIATGVYYDQISGNTVVVRDGKATLTPSDSGVVVLTMSKNLARPTVSPSSHGESFVGNLTVTVTATNFSNAFYTINGGDKVVISENETKIKLGDVVDENNNIVLRIFVENEQFIVERFYNFSTVQLIDGYFNVININPTYFTDYELYMWSWNPSTWSKNYKVQDGVLLVKIEGFDTGFLLALFEKGYEVENVHAWDSNAIKQTADIKGNILKAGFYDASTFQS